MVGGSSKSSLSKEQAQLAASFLGKHVSQPKAVVLFAAAVIMCLAPILMGLRYWEAIPEIITTGLTDISGNDDPLPRWALVYAIPGLMAILTTICHAQLWLNQRRQTVPKASIRILGRWVIPVVAVFFCSWAISSCAGENLNTGFLLLCAAGAALVLLGAHLFDCRQSSSLALNFGFAKSSEGAWRMIHRFAGCCSMLSGLIILVMLEYSGSLPIHGAAAAVLLLTAPPLFCAVKR